MNEDKDVIVIGGGPAGLAAGYALAKNGTPVTVLERENSVGGISATVEWKGYYFDKGGHRFFTKNDQVNDLWEEVLGDKFLHVSRLSRIIYNKRLFYYPLRPMNAFVGLGPLTAFYVIMSYTRWKLFPYKNVTTFEQWITNRFGKKLFEIFFKTYTEKVWGIPCSEIAAEWAAQRIKSLSLMSAVKSAFFKPRSDEITTLIDKFRYPEFGPGMMYNQMREKVVTFGGGVRVGCEVVGINRADGKIASVVVKSSSGETSTLSGTDFISSMPITDLILKMNPLPPSEIVDAAKSLRFRDFLTVNLIVNKKDVVPDNWIYVHSPEVRLGRIQNYKNWSTSMVADQNKTSLGLEYFCFEGDEFWSKKDSELVEIGKRELRTLNLIDDNDEIEDGFVVRVKKCYPIYQVGYKKHLDAIKDFLSSVENLSVVGRYGMFRYNNMDHSILTGLYAAENILGAHHNIWDVNTEQEYHEEKK